MEIVPVVGRLPPRTVTTICMKISLVASMEGDIMQRGTL